MTKVWAFSGLQTSFMKNREWEEVIPFKGLTDLIAEMRTRNLMNQVDVLAIVSHGDRAGVVQLTPPLTNVDAARGQFVQLRSFVKSGGKLIFFACQVAGGKTGDVFLQKISAVMAGCHIIGFIVANEVKGPQPGSIHVYSDNSRRNDEWSEETKWAFDGAITKPPNLEVLWFQQEDPKKGNHCGSDKCPGHIGRGLSHCCNPYRRSGWPQGIREM